MKIIFTKNNSIASRSIRSVTNEPVSHVALDFEKFIVHSNFLGLHISWHTAFKKKSEIVYSLKSENYMDHFSRLDKTLEKSQFSLYDFGAMFFLGLSILLRRYFKVPLPKSNLWQSTGMYMCTEWVTDFIDQKEDSIITPYKLYVKLQKTGKWV